MKKDQVGEEEIGFFERPQLPGPAFQRGSVCLNAQLSG